MYETPNLPHLVSLYTNTLAPFYAIENQTQIRFGKHWQVAKTVHTMFPIIPLIKRFPFDPDKFTMGESFVLIRLSLHTNSRKRKQ